LEKALLARHALELTTLPKFRELRTTILRSIEEPAPRLSGKGRGRYRRNPAMA
jgi:hypothetical protein